MTCDHRMRYQYVEQHIDILRGNDLPADERFTSFPLCDAFLTCRHMAPGVALVCEHVTAIYANARHRAAKHKVRKGALLDNLLPFLAGHWVFPTVFRHSFHTL